jgi:hypothetical protein
MSGGWAARASFLALAACSSSGGAAPQTPPSDACVPFVPDADLTLPVQFATNIAPVFQTSCAMAGGGIGCHSAGNASPFLGSSDGGADAATILASIVGIEAGEDPEMDYIAPNQPEQSYLMHKMDGDQCTLAAQCALSIYQESPACGSSMPFLSNHLLPVSTRDQVRAWISQGAQNN